MEKLYLTSHYYSFYPWKELYLSYKTLSLSITFNFFFSHENQIEVIDIWVMFSFTWIIIDNQENWIKQHKSSSEEALYFLICEL